MRTTRRPPRAGLPAWRAAALVLGLVLVPLTLTQLVDTIGGDPNKPGHTFWTFAVTAAAGWYAAFARGLRWGALFAGLAVIVSWIALCDALFDPSPTALRWLSLIVGVALAAAVCHVSTAKASARVPSSLRPPAWPA